jgi:hypothetical protein
MSGALRRWAQRLREPFVWSTASADVPARLVVCDRCGEWLVNPVDWHESGDADWWIRLRCGACGHKREVVVSDAEALRLERDLAPGLRAIERAVRRLDRERMQREADALITALERDLIGPADFAR